MEPSDLDDPITDSATLADFCAELARHPYICVDTEFIRDKTYWPQLCLIQLSAPNGDDPDAGPVACVDALAEGLDLQPVYDLLADPKLLKVFHAARQDLEIFYIRMGSVPAPIFDTQVAAMVCGYGDQVGYEALVRKICKAELDKSSRFTDWAARPLEPKQLRYARADVTHLRRIYQSLSDQLERNARTDWLSEEMAILSSAETYRNEPEEAWRRLKARNAKPRMLAVLKEIAAWREREAQNRDVPRSRILRDDSLMDIAASAPRDTKAMRRIRGLPNGFAEGKFGQALLDAVERGVELPHEERPVPPKSEPLPPGLQPLVDLLKVLLKANAAEAGVASRLVANAEELERIAADDGADVPALKGWRRKLFGEQALALKHGRIALTAGPEGVELIEREQS
ncbi:ribonuclease D [Marivibrio halodurans]|uniref:Ribonuclease D n=1 Tax=Marivibrio halodurans TaxID=2039722 RepID=A0A8J7S3N9_9PROT|nr:ribonuclease D [Marivibrio halodurans]MBP5856119.1 ribonuclease D [Marivibrio halodurans]